MRKHRTREVQVEDKSDTAKNLTLLSRGAERAALTRWNSMKNSLQRPATQLQPIQGKIFVFT